MASRRGHKSASSVHGWTMLPQPRGTCFRTFPEDAASFTFALGSCQLGGSNGQVFDAMRELEPLFVVAMGDWTYGNIDRNDPSRFQA